MLTISGRIVLPDNDVAPALSDVALALGRKPRWGGQTRTPFNVLAHSFVVASYVAVEYRVAALLHDAGEILADLPTSWKTDADRDREHKMLRRIHQELNWPVSLNDAPIVKAADTRALRSEATCLMPRTIGCIPVWGVQPIEHESLDWFDVQIADFWVHQCRDYPTAFSEPEGKWVMWYVKVIEAAVEERTECIEQAAQAAEGE